MIYPDFCGGSYTASSPNAAQMRSMNVYPERVDTPGASTPMMLVLIPGVTKMTLTLPAIATPGAPTVTNQGTPGATAYGYKIVGLLGDGTTHTEAGAEGTTATGNATLSGGNFNRLTWAALTNARSYRVYRTTGGATPPVLLTTTTLTTYDDTGSAGTAQTPPTSNMTGVAFTPSGPGRGHYVEPSTGREFAVIGSLLYEITLNGLLTPHGSVALDASPATFASNGDAGGQMLIGSGGNAYYFTLATNVLTQIAALNGVANIVAHMDGYGLAFDFDESAVFQSDLNDFSTWDPTNTFQRSIAGDPWNSMIVANRFIRLLGEQTSESWYDSGSFPIPFVPHSSGLIEYGCAASYSPEIVAGAVCWLGATANGRGKVLRMSGLTPEVISTPALELAISGYLRVDDAIGDTYEENGHSFYLLYFPTARATWVWDAQTQLWHERGTWLSEAAAYDVWRPCFHAFVFGQHRMLDLQTGHVYVLSSSVYTDVDDINGDARPIRWLRRAPALVMENRRLFYPGFEVDVQPGIGLSSGQGSDPQVMMRMSDDGGQTWGNELSASAGAQGEYSRRVQWPMCGSAPRRVFEISGSDPVPWRILNGYLPDFERANRGSGRGRRVA